MFKLPIFLKSRSSVFLKILMSYVTVFTVPLFILGIISYLWTFDIVKENVEKTYLNAVHDVRKNIDAKIGALNGMSVHLSELTWVQKIMYMRGSEIDYSSVNPFSFNYNIKDLNTYKGINGFVADMAINFNEKDLVISSQGKYSLNSFYEDVFYYEGLTPEYWRSALSDYNVSTLKAPVRVLTYKQPRKLLTYIQSLPVGSKNFKAVFIAFIEENTLVDLLNISSVSKSGSLYIIDSKGNLITGINCDDKLKELLSDKNTLTASPQAEIENFEFPEGEKYIMFQSKSSVNDWSYIAAIPLTVAMTKVNNIKTITMLISLFSLIVGFVISYFLALKSYSPLADIVKSISPKLLNLNSPQKRPNEYNFLQKALHSMLEYEDRTKEEIELYKPLAQNSLFIHLLRGSHDSGSRLLKVMDITFSNSCFTCASVILDSENTLSEKLNANITAELSNYKATAYFVEIGGKNKVIIFNTAYEQQMAQIMDIVIVAFNRSQIKYKAIGVGKTYTGLDCLCNSYNEANTAIEHRFIRGNSSIIYYEDIEGAYILPSYYYPTEKEEHLVNFIMCGNHEEAIKLFNEIISSNIIKSNLTPEIARNLFYNMAVSALKALERLNIGLRPAFHLDDFFHMDTIHEMKEYIEELYHHVCDIIIDEKESKNTKLRDDILDYINKHLTDSNLTLTSLADKFGGSLAYFSRFIKDQTGTNFVDYLNKRRIELSRSLLKNDMTIREVSHQVGFDNDLTFRRLFKKYTGINPGEFKNIDTVSKCSKT